MKKIVFALLALSVTAQFSEASTLTVQNPMIGSRRIAPNWVLTDRICLQHGYTKSSQMLTEKVRVEEVHSYVVQALTAKGFAGRDDQDEIMDFLLAVPLGGLLQNKVKLVKSINCE